MTSQSRSISGFAKILFCLSGFAALAYQLLSFKMISAAGMGDGLSVAVSLTSFVALAGLGAVIGPKGLNIFRAEILLGLWAVSSFGIVHWLDFSVFVNLFSDGSMVEKLLTFLGLTAPLAFLSGALVPIYEKQIGEDDSEPKGRAFILIYLLFHIGGAAGLILLELNVGRILRLNSLNESLV